MNKAAWVLGLGVATAAASAVSTPALADEDACAAILTSVQSIGKAPQYRSVLVATSPTRRRPFETEQIVVDDMLYATSPAAGRWMKLPMTAADREALAAGLVRYPPHHCEAAVPDAEDAPMRVYAYRQDVSGPDSADSRLWVAKKDGLPRRLESEEGTMRVVVTLEYEGVKPPQFQEPAPP